MKKIEEYFDNTDDNNRIIQKMLRELDMDSLFDLCAYLGDKNEMILRNLSKRIREQVVLYLDQNQGKIPQHSMKKAGFKVSKIFLFLEDRPVNDLSEYLVERLTFSTKEEIRKSLITLFHYNVKQDIERLNSLIRSVKDSLIRKQLELVLYGDDPIKGEYRISRIMEQKKEDDRIKSEILKEGILSILSEESVESLFERLDV